LMFLVSSNFSSMLMLLNSFLLIFTVILTRMIYLPILQELSQKHNSILMLKLINLNWIRTLGWSLKVILMILITIEMLFIRL
jgi:hypothetical protein